MTAMAELPPDIGIRVDARLLDAVQALGKNLDRVERERDALCTACRDLLKHAVDVGRWSAIAVSPEDYHSDRRIRADNALEAIRFARSVLDGLPLAPAAGGERTGGERSGGRDGGKD